MKKKLVIIGIIFLILTVGLSGCNGDNDLKLDIEEWTYDECCVNLYGKAKLYYQDSWALNGSVFFDVEPKGPAVGELTEVPIDKYGGTGNIYLGLIYLYKDKDPTSVKIIASGHIWDQPNPGNYSHYSQHSTLTFNQASNNGTRNSFSWAPYFEFNFN